jgi:hypothetical protein
MHNLFKLCNQQILRTEECSPNGCCNRMRLMQTFSAKSWSQMKHVSHGMVFWSHNMHTWNDENPHLIHEIYFQHWFTINVWAGIVSDLLTRPYELLSRLSETSLFTIFNWRITSTTTGCTNGKMTNYSKVRLSRTLGEWGVPIDRFCH